jgi:hypothetical protein
MEKPPVKAVSSERKTARAHKLRAAVRHIQILVGLGRAARTFTAVWLYGQPRSGVHTGKMGKIDRKCATLRNIALHLASKQHRPDIHVRAMLI